MSGSYKICPICDTDNHANVTVCATCGTDLSAVEMISRQQPGNGTTIKYDFRYGETDFQEGSVSQVASTYLVIIVTVIVTFALVGIVLFVANSVLSPDTEENPVEEFMGTASSSPTIDAATVTIGPPTATYTFTPPPTLTPAPTATQGPCVITLPQGQTLIWALGQCGHRSLDVMPTVLALNNLSDAGNVRSGQEISIPRPTATIDPDAVSADTPVAEGDAIIEDGFAVALSGPDESIEAFQATVTPTLPPGVMWHEIQQGQNIISVAVQYNTDVQTLSQLNRQVDFARCDFGETYGGQDCIVQLFQGQLLRVPAPTVTPTLSPTPDPNATATPTPTATVNIPDAFSPSDHEFFYNDEFVTLRWVPTATLLAGDSYYITVTDLTTGRVFTALTTNIFFTIPADWQGGETRHEFEWTVGIVSQATPHTIRHETAPLTFVWQGIPATESD